MAANVETMFATRSVPWHGLGTIVQTAPTSADAIELAGLNWKVISNPVYDIDGKEIRGFKANTRDSDQSVLGIVSDRYKIVQNNEAFNFTDNLIEEEEITYETAGSLRHGKQIWLLAKMPEAKVLGEQYDPYICFSNVHDGTGAIKVCMTPVRVVCQNTLNIALSTAKRTWSTRHVGDMEGKLAEARETLGMAKEYMTELDVMADKLANQKISDDEIAKVINDLFPVDMEKDSERKINNVETLKSNFQICYMMPDIAQFRNTKWGVIQAMADMADHMQPARKTDTYQENNWGRIMSGHPFVDALVSKMVAA